MRFEVSKVLDAIEARVTPYLGEAKAAVTSLSSVSLARREPSRE